MRNASVSFFIQICLTIQNYCDKMEKNQGGIILIFLDNASGSRLYPEVIEVMTDVMTNHWANASADYSFGHESMQLIENVREQIAKDINCSPEEIIFTSGACEANSLALLGTPDDIQTLWVSNLEHASIEKIHYHINYLIPNYNDGTIKIDKFAEYLEDFYWHSRRSGFIVSVCAANGEIGTIQDLKVLSDITHKYGGIFHTDATQLYAEQKIDVKAQGIDLMSVSAQKFHGPRGVGFLYVRNGIALEPLIYGSQENSMRGGTYNTAAIVGMGKALELTRASNQTKYIRDLRDKLLYNLLAIPGSSYNGPAPDLNRLVNNISLTVDGIDADQLVAMCDEQGFMIARGAACQAYNPVPSQTLLAIGLSERQALSTVRITLDEFNTEEEIVQFSEIFTKIIERLRLF